MVFASSVVVDSGLATTLTMQALLCHVLTQSKQAMGTTTTVIPPLRLRKDSAGFQLSLSCDVGTYLSADSDALAKHFDFDTFSTAGGIILQYKKQSQMLRLSCHHS